MSDRNPANEMSSVNRGFVPFEEADFSRPPPPAGHFSNANQFNRYGAPIYVIVNSAQSNNNPMPVWPGQQTPNHGPGPRMPFQQPTIHNPGPGYSQGDMMFHHNMQYQQQPAENPGPRYSHGDMLRPLQIQQEGTGNQVQGFPQRDMMLRPLQIQQEGTGNQVQGFPQRDMMLRPLQIQQEGTGNQVQGFPQRDMMLRPLQIHQEGTGNQVQGFPQRDMMLRPLQIHQEGTGNQVQGFPQRDMMLRPLQIHQEGTGNPFPFLRAQAPAMQGHGRVRVTELPPSAETEEQPLLAIGWKDEESVQERPVLRRSCRVAASHRQNIVEDLVPSTSRKNAPKKAAPCNKGIQQSDEDSQSDEEKHVKDAAQVRSTSRKNAPKKAPAPGPSKRGIKEAEQDSESDEEKPGKGAAQKSVGHGREETMESDSGSQSATDDLGRWMDGDDDLSSDFEPKKKISKANQAKKSTALNKRINKALGKDETESEDEGPQRQVSKPKKQPSGQVKRKKTDKKQLSDSDEDFEREARGSQQASKKSLSLKNTKSSKSEPAEATFAAGAHPESETSSVIDDPDIVILSDTDTDEETDVKLSRKEGSLEGTRFQIRPRSMPEEWCTICFNDYEDVTQEDADPESGTAFVGIMENCHCHRFCYVCALAVLYSNDPKCPRCREPVVNVVSYPFSLDLLVQE